MVHGGASSARPIERLSPSRASRRVPRPRPRVARVSAPGPAAAPGRFVRCLKKRRDACALRLRCEQPRNQKKIKIDGAP